MTSPPQPNKVGKKFPSPAQAAIYLNESEYLSYRNPRIASYAQYLLDDPQDLRSKKVGLFSSGLLFSNGSFQGFNLGAGLRQRARGGLHSANPALPTSGVFKIIRAGSDAFR